MDGLDVSAWATDIKNELEYLMGDMKTAIEDRIRDTILTGEDDVEGDTLADQLEALKRAARSIDACIAFRRL